MHIDQLQFFWGKCSLDRWDKANFSESYISSIFTDKKLKTVPTVKHGEGLIQGAWAFHGTMLCQDYQEIIKQNGLDYSVSESSLSMPFLFYLCYDTKIFWLKNNNHFILLNIE